MIQGETGTGKELVARAVRELSGAEPFVVLNSSVFASELIDSELFGHEKGAFSGAVAARNGLIEAANGGILFLDEVTDLSLPAQTKILRVVEYGDFRRVGSTHVRKSIFRLLAASNKNYPDGIPTSLVITTNDGKKHDSGFVMYPAGHARNADANLRDILATKFEMLGSLALKNPRPIIDRFNNLAKLPSKELASLYEFELLKRTDFE